MCFAHIFWFRIPGTGLKKSIAAGSGFNGCATATDFHRDSLLDTINMEVNISGFPAIANGKSRKKQVFFQKNIRLGKRTGKSGRPGPVHGLRAGAGSTPCQQSRITRSTVFLFGESG